LSRATESTAPKLKSSTATGLRWARCRLATRITPSRIAAESAAACIPVTLATTPPTSCASSQIPTHLSTDRVLVIDPLCWRAGLLVPEQPVVDHHAHEAHDHRQGQQTVQLAERLHDPEREPWVAALEILPRRLHHAGAHPVDRDDVDNQREQPD